MPNQAGQKKRLDLAHAALAGDDETAILEALDRIEADGDARSIKPLLRTLASTGHEAVRRRISGLINTVKAPNAVPELIAALDDPELLSSRRDIITAVWSAGLDVRDHLDRFVDLAVEGDMQQCLDCLSVIENQEVWPDKAARLGVARVRKAAASEPDQMKASLLVSIALELEDRLGVAS